ncbi:CaiB/BaiF CoA transferase family protein [Myxococcota bacterium]
MAEPLEDILVVDLTRVLAGPLCTMVLGDLGAEVIKIERPDRGDDARGFDPFVRDESAYFMSLNRGKKSLTLDLKHPQGREILTKLAAQADVLVENFTPGVMSRLGLGYEDLHPHNPRLVYASCSGFGQTGPYRNRPAYDLIIQGMGGLMSITGFDAAHPTKVGTSIADILAGLFTCIGILTALHHRQASGRGQHVDVAMLDAVVASLEAAVARHSASGEVPTPIGNRHPSISPFATLKTADGFVNVACGNDELWRRLCTVLRLDQVRRDPRFSSNSSRVSNWSALEPLLQQATRQRPTDEWLTALQEAGVPAGPINDVAALFSDPQVAARQMLVDLVHPTAGKLQMAGAPIKLSETPGEVSTAAPTLGADTDEVLQRILDLGSDQISKLRQDGAFG